MKTRADYFSRNLCKIMEHRKLSNKELSKQTGVSERTIVRYKYGESSPRFDYMEKIARALNVPFRDMLSKPLNEDV